MIHTGRFTAQREGDFVVFLIGMRVNKPLRIQKWWPVASAMPRMLAELGRHAEMGYLGGHAWFGRTVFMLQYWRSMDQLLAYAKDKEAAHLPAWRAFNRSIGHDGSVGIWHETYAIAKGRYENIYVNMPPFGLGAIAERLPAGGHRETAAGRLPGAPTPVAPADAQT